MESQVTHEPRPRVFFHRMLRSRLSRRNLLVASAAMPLTNWLLAACGGDDGDDEPTEPPQDAATATTVAPSAPTTAATNTPAVLAQGPTATSATAASTPAPAPTAPPTPEPIAGVEGGTLTVAMAGEPNSMDQHAGSARNNEFVNAAIYDRLVEIGDDRDYYPGLATSWEVSSDGLVWTLTLQEGVTFHDGTPFDAGVVEHNFDRIKDPATNSQKAIGLLGPHASSEVVDDVTIELTYSEVYAPFLDSLADFYLVMQSPAAIEEWGVDYAQHPVGTGPFIFEEWLPQDRLTLRRNPDYNWGSPVFGHQGPAFLDEIVFRFIAEEGTRVTTLETGETDVINGVPPQDYERLNDDSGLSILNAPFLGQAPGLIVNVERPPTDDFNVRLALQYAVNQADVIDTVFYGVYERSHGPLTQFNQFYDPTIEGMYEYDPDRAMELLDEAGWTMDGDFRQKDGQELKLVYLTFPAGTGYLTAELVQAQLREVGINVEILPLNNPANLAAAQAGDHHIRWLSWYFSDAAGLAITFHSENIGTGWNFTRFRSQELDSFLDEGRAELDPERRAEIYSQIQRLVLENALLVPLYVISGVIATRAEVQGIRMHPQGDPMFYTAYIDE